MAEQRTMCPIRKSECVQENCRIWQFVPEGEVCPVGLEENSLEAIKQALSSAAKYADEVLGIDKYSGKDLIQQILESVKEGKVDLAKLVRDALNVK